MHKLKHKGEIISSDSLQKSYDKFVEVGAEVSSTGPLKEEHLHGAADIETGVCGAVESVIEVDIDGIGDGEEFE